MLCVQCLQVTEQELAYEQQTPVSPNFIITYVRFYYIFEQIFQVQFRDADRDFTNCIYALIQLEKNAFGRLAEYLYFFDLCLFSFATICGARGHQC